MNRYAWICALVLFAACTPYEQYAPPATVVPIEWKNPSQQPCEHSDALWWQIFNDETLNQLESMALKKNYSLEQAFYNWQRASALAYADRSRLFPQAHFNPSFNKQESLFQVQGLAALSGQEAIAPFRVEQSLYSIPLNVNYEIDLWNRLLDSYKSKLYSAQAELEAYNDAILIVTTDIATHYFTLRGLDAELDVLNKNIQIRQQALDITQSRYEAGLTTFIDVSQAKTQLDSIKSERENSLRLRNLEENILSTFVGNPASNFSLPYSPLEGPPPLVSSVLPAELLLRRPDLRQAEREMASTHQQVAVEYAAYFPSLTLQGGIGWMSPLWHNLLDWQTRFWQIASDLSQIIFDGGRVKGNVDAAKATYMQSVATYQQQVLIAFQEVENALGNIDFQHKQRKNLTSAVESASETLKLSLDRYTQGLVYYLEVVDAERTLLANQKELTLVRTQIFLSTVALIKSIGGTWNNEKNIEP